MLKDDCLCSLCLFQLGLSSFNYISFYMSVVVLLSVPAYGKMSSTCLKQMIIAGYILSVYQFMLEERGQSVAGFTPVRRRGMSSQTQVS